MRSHMGAALAVACFASFAPPSFGQAPPASSMECSDVVSKWKGRDVAVPRSALPKPRKGEVYLADLVGLEVVSVSGAVLGRVVAIEDYGAHPLMRIAPGGGEARLVPFVEPIVRAVDLQAKRIEVEWEPEY